MKKILFLIELPPPFHGITFINNVINKFFKDNENVIIHDVNFSNKINEIGIFSINKIIINFKIIFSSWKMIIFKNPKKIYFSLSMSRIGIIRDFILVLPSIILMRKRIIHLHGTTIFSVYKNSLLFKMLFNILSFNSTLIALCYAQKERLQNEIILNNKTTIEVIHNTVINDEVEVKKSPHNIINLLYISNICEEKGIYNLIDSISDIDGIILHIAGDFYYNEEEKFYSIIRDKKISSKIEYYGFADEELKKKLFNKCHIFVLPSQLEEGSPVSIIEAMSYGLPIIATNKGCIPEMINNCGIVISDKFDNKTFLKAFNEIRKNYKEYSSLSLSNFYEIYDIRIFIKNFFEKIIWEE